MRRGRPAAGTGGVPFQQEERMREGFFSVLVTEGGEKAGFGLESESFPERDIFWSKTWSPADLG